MEEKEQPERFGIYEDSSIDIGSTSWLRPGAPGEMRSKEEVQRAHDLCAAFVGKEIPIILPEEYLLPLHASLDAICWVLRHEHAGNKGEGFQRNLLELEELVAQAGIVRIEAEQSPAIQAEREAVANLFGVGVRSDRIVFLRAVPRELEKKEALLLAAWIVAQAEERHGEFGDLLSRVMAT